MFDALRHDVRFAMRALRRSPAVTAIAILTLALGVGVNTAVFSVFESILLNPLPYANPERLVSVAETGAGRVQGVSPWVADEWKAGGRAIEAIGLHTDGQLVMTGDGEPEVFRGQRVTAGFFDTLGVQPLFGRLFTPEDDRPPRAAVVVLTYALWSTRFGGDPRAVGRLVTLNGEPYRIIGVLGREFRPLRMSNPAEEPRIFAPLGDDPIEAARCRSCDPHPAIARLSPGVSIARAHDELGAAMRRFNETYPADFAADAGVQIASLKDEMTRGLRPALLIALAAAGCVLLIACANLANLQLIRATSRASEFALRGALGSSRSRLAAQVLLETLIVAAAGCALGVALGRAGVAVLTALAPRELPRLGEIGLDMRVLLGSAALGVATAVASALAPAWLASRTDVNEALRHAGERIIGGRGHRARAALVVSEIALAFVLLAATGLLVKTVSRLLSVDAGFDPRHVLTMTPVVMGTPGMTQAAMLRKKQQMVDAVRAVRGVTSAALVNDVPLSHTIPIQVAIEGAPSAAGQRLPLADVFTIEGDYFATLRIALRKGRLLTRHDGDDAPPAVVVSESFARRHFPDEDALGRRIRLSVPDEKMWLTIVGVVADVRNVALDRAADDAVYQPLAMYPFHYIRVVARTDGDPSRLALPIRDAIRAIDPLVPIFHVQPMNDYVASSIAQRRFALALMIAFGGLALVLAAIGLYGVLAYLVVVRTPEMGVRAALGATPRDLLALVLGRGILLTASGIVAGLLIAIATTRTINGLLFQVEASDPTTFAIAAAVVAAASVIASYVPARRGARIDPLRAIRHAT